MQNRDEKPFGALRALDPTTGDKKWEFLMPTPSRSGILTTASNLLFSGDGDGNLLALDSRSGKLLWRYQMGATLHGTSPITYMLDGRQHLLVPSGTIAYGVDAARDHDSNEVKSFLLRLQTSGFGLRAGRLQAREGHPAGSVTRVLAQSQKPEACSRHGQA